MNMLKTQLKSRRIMNLKLIWLLHPLTLDEIGEEEFTALLAMLLINLWMINNTPNKTKANESLTITSPVRLDRTAGIEGEIIGVRSGRTYTGQLVETKIVAELIIIET